jgi:hypothetical protein
MAIRDDSGLWRGMDDLASGLRAERRAMACLCSRGDVVHFPACGGRGGTNLDFQRSRTGAGLIPGESI